MRITAIITVLAIAGVARADHEDAKLEDYFAALTAGTWPGGGEVAGTAPRFVFTPSEAVISPDTRRTRRRRCRTGADRPRTW
jgi:hypothetical protein